MTYKIDSVATKWLKLIPMSSGNVPKNGIYADVNGNINVAIAGVKVATLGQIPGANGVVPPASGIVQIGQLLGANMNVTTDQNIPLTLPAGFTKYRIDAIYANNASISLTTAAGGIYPAATKGGTPIVAAAQAYAGLTAPGDNAAGSALALTLAAAAATTEFNAVQTALGLFFALTTAQGAAATADIYVFARVFR